MESSSTFSAEEIQERLNNMKLVSLRACGYEEDRPLHNTKNVKLMLAYMSSRYEGELQLRKGKQFLFSEGGVTDSPRELKDWICVFGSNTPRCPVQDIRFPEADGFMEPIHALLVHSNNSPMLIDTSEAGSVSLRLYKHDMHQITKGSMIRFSNDWVVRVKEIRTGYSDNKESRPVYSEDGEMETLSSTLVIKHVKGRYPGRVEEISTHRDRMVRNEFIIGKGGIRAGTDDVGIAPDLLLNGDPGIGIKHAMFRYHQQTWYIADNNSTNGTYLLLKNYEQYKRRVPSDPFPLFKPSNCPHLKEVGEFAVFCVGFYRFLCELEDI